MSVTSKTWETASFTCDLTQDATYIHLYKQQEGWLPDAFSTMMSTTPRLSSNQEPIKQNTVFIKAQEGAIDLQS